MIKVFIIDDAMLVRNRIKKMLKDQKDIIIIGEAPNPVDAIPCFKEVGFPDVFILDLEMPKMDGLDFLKQLKVQRPVPTIIFSSLVAQKSTKAIEALEFGACDIVLKPKNMNDVSQEDFINDFVSKIKAAAQSKMLDSTSIKSSSLHSTPSSRQVVAIGASTGGVQTIEILLKSLQPKHPPIMIVQHMPAGFTTSFAKRLNNICTHSKVVESKGNEALEEGVVYISPGNLHLEVLCTKKNEYKTVLKDYPKVSNHKPSVDVLFKSIAREVKENATAFILTGMGKDGATGIEMVKNSKGKTFGQDEESCIVYGMPKVAYEIGALNKQVSLQEIADIINSMR